MSKKWVTDGYNKIVLLEYTETGYKIMEEKTVDSWENNPENHEKASAECTKLNKELTNA